MLQDRAARRDIGFLAAAAVFLVAVAVTLGAIRGYSYAIWFGMPMVAAMALRLFAALQLKTIWARALRCAAADAAGAVDRRHRHRQRQRAQRPRSVRPPGQQGLHPDRELRAAGTTAAGDRRDRRQLRPVPAGADAAFGAGRAVSSSVEGHRRGAPQPRRAARAGPRGAGGEPRHLRHDLRPRPPDGSPSPSAAAACGASFAPARCRIGLSRSATPPARPSRCTG